METVKAMKAVLLAEKEKNKIGKQAKALKLLEECKDWGGPVTEKSVHTLNELDEKQLLVKVRYLRASVAPNIREKRKEGNKMIKFDKAQLIDQIKNVINPVSNECQDVEGILSCIFKVQENNENEFESGDVPSEGLIPGVVGQFEGPLSESKVGVVVAVGERRMLRLYESRRLGYIPSLSPQQPLEDCKMVEEIVDYYHVTYPTKPDIVILKF